MNKFEEDFEVVNGSHSNKSFYARTCGVVASCLADESGATSIEYAMIATGLAIVIIAGIGVLGGAINGSLQTVAGLF